MLEAWPQAKEKAMNDRVTSNHIAEDLERTSSEASGKGCSERSQLHKRCQECVNEAGRHLEHFI